MAINLNDNIAIGVGAPIDNKYLNGSNAPYADTVEVNATIPISLRYQGLTVNVDTIEYWYQDGVDDVDLVPKSGSGGSGERIEKSFTQAAHGFVEGNVVLYSGGTFFKAIADGSQSGEIVGIVTHVENANEFTVTFSGYIDEITGWGLSPSTTYYLSTTVAGALSASDTFIFDTLSKPILTTFTIDDALVYQYRGFVVTSGATGTEGISGITALSNIGGGSGVFKETLGSITGQTSFLRTLIGSGGTTITVSGNTLVINSDTAGIYNLASPANVDLGGISDGTILTGKTANEILEELLVVVYTPTFVAPSNTFTDNQANTQEVGFTAATVNFTATFNRGQILVNAILQNFRSGLPNTYTYTDNGNVDQSLPASVASNSLNNGQILNNVVVLSGSNTWSSTVSYDVGPQPLDSNGNPSGSPLVAGTTSSKSVTINGIYPWFYGTFASSGAVAGDNRPSGSTALLTGGTKVVAISDDTVIPNFGSTSDDYIWVAIPDTSTLKTVWYVNALNNGVIGGSISPAGNLFPDPDIISVNSPSGFWSGVDYKFYISNVQTAATIMEFRES